MVIHYAKIVTGAYVASDLHSLSDATEVQLREAELRADFRDDLVIDEALLAGPEWGRPAPIAPGGELEGVMFAWTDLAAAEAYNPPWNEAGCYAFVVIDTDDWEPDPLSEAYADAGSVKVHTGHVARIDLASWARPVAQVLSNRYVVPVLVAPDFQIADVTPEPAEPIIIPDVLTKRQCEKLRRAPEIPRSTGQVRPGSVQLNADDAVTGVPLRDILPPVLTEAAREFNLPVDTCRRTGILHYSEGGYHFDHVDRDRAKDPLSDARTVSMSVALNDDFDGGEFVTPYGSVDLRPGDAVAFTSATRHRVEPVRNGERDVLITLAGWTGWPAGYTPLKDAPFT